jgi:hypothetical protein
MQKFIGKFASEDGRFLIADGAIKAFAPAGMTSVIIPDGVTSIGRYVFSGYEIESVTIPEGVTTIGEEAFFECQSLASINIPNTVTTIGESAFGVCYGLKSLTIPDSVTTIGYGAFQSCKNLTSVTIGSGLTEISTWMFAGCSSLTDIVIPESVSAIGARAFGSCSSLTRVDCLPTTPPTIGSEIFYDVSADCKIYVPDGTYDTYVTADGWVDYKDMIVNPNPAPAVQSQIFYTTTDENVVSLYDTTVFLDADGNSLNIVSNIYENGQGVITLDGEVKTIGSAFANRSTLESVIIPEGVTRIGYPSEETTRAIGVTISSIFWNCTSLVDVKLPESLAILGRYTFKGCSQLGSVDIPDGVDTIAEYTFENCKNLTSITIPDGVIYIGSYAFNGCSGLTSITIPDGVTSIGDYAFEGCSGLTSVYCRPTTPPTLGADAFNSNASDRKIYVPTSSTDAYQAAENWSSYADAIVGYDF